MRLNITGCRLFFAPASLFTPSPRPVGRSMNTVCYTTVQSCPNWPEEFVSNFTMRLHITACRLFWAPEVHLPHSVIPRDLVWTLCMLYDGFTIPKLSWRSYFHRGTQYERSVCYMTVPPCQICPQVIIFHFTSQTEYSMHSCFQHIIFTVISAMWYNVKFLPCSKM